MRVGSNNADDQHVFTTGSVSPSHVILFLSSVLSLSHLVLSPSHLHPGGGGPPMRQRGCGPPAGRLRRRPRGIQQQIQGHARGGPPGEGTRRRLPAGILRRRPLSRRQLLGEGTRRRLPSRRLMRCPQTLAPLFPIPVATSLGVPPLPAISCPRLASARFPAPEASPHYPALRASYPLLH